MGKGVKQKGCSTERAIKRKGGKEKGCSVGKEKGW